MLSIKGKKIPVLNVEKNNVEFHSWQEMEDRNKTVSKQLLLAFCILKRGFIF